MIYVGCTLKPVENWQQILPAPTAPSNYKDPKKINDYIQAKLDELMNGSAAMHILSGSIAEGVILEPDGTKKVTGNGIDLIEELLKSWRATQDGPVFDHIAGYKIHRNLRLAAIDYVSSGKPLPHDAMWVVGGSTHMKYGIDWFDPVSALFGTSDEDKVDVDGVCRRLGIEADLSSALGQAEFAKALTDRIVEE